jgi:Holliday junction resolvase RusA-like endonuclease
MAPHRPASPIEGPVRLRVTFLLPRPKNRCRRKDSPEPLWCTTKPDFDNLSKAIADCLTQQGWWRDDAQVVEAHITKQWHAIGERPGAWIQVSPI